MNDPDAHIRASAFSAMEKLVRYQPDGLVSWDAIHRGFQVGSERIHFADRKRIISLESSSAVRDYNGRTILKVS